MTFPETEKNLKDRLHAIADAVKIVEKQNVVFAYPVASANLVKIKEQLEETIRIVDEQIYIIKRHWENGDKVSLSGSLTRLQNFEVFYNDHGWGSQWIKVRYHEPSCDLLLEQVGDRIKYNCMCLGASGGEIHKNELPDLIVKYSKHGCIPWGG